MGWVVLVGTTIFLPYQPLVGSLLSMASREGIKGRKGVVTGGDMGRDAHEEGMGGSVRDNYPLHHIDPPFRSPKGRDLKGGGMGVLLGTTNLQPR